MNWKATAGAAVFASTISLLAGLIRGNPFGVILVRLLLSALFMGGLTMAARVVLKRFLPELARLRPSGPGPSGDDEAGDGFDRPLVDILLPEEYPHGDEPGEVEELPADSIAPPLGRASPAAGAGAETSAHPEVGPRTGRAGGEFSEWEETAEPATLFDDSGEPEELEAALDGGDLDEGSGGQVDSLPEIDRLDGSFGAKPGPSGRTGGSARNQLEHRMQGQDPMELAKAVRTFMKKDQEG